MGRADGFPFWTTTGTAEFELVTFTRDAHFDSFRVSSKKEISLRFGDINNLSNASIHSGSLSGNSGTTR
ncbi:hypothetical protein SDC9_89986 [bioreactor metagenome]|uniref:Uncharacterized protein n=1 Tax=bioreactor metagenome TaxID=1076179 RepID=A0A644ZXF1_9ZZZZ